MWRSILTKKKELEFLKRLLVFEPKPFQSFDSRWQETFGKVKAFVEKNKKIPSEHSKDKEEKRLGIWCCTQKQIKKKGKITPERIKALEVIPGWYWEIDLDEKWQKILELVKTFVGKNEKIPSNHSKDKEEKRLGGWCSKQKQSRKNGKMTSERIKALKSIPGWEWKKDLDLIWQETLEKVKAFVKKNNKIPYVNSKDKEEKRLGSWCSNQKTAKKKVKITPERNKQLESIPGWLWENDYDLIWKETLELLKSFAGKNEKFPSEYSKDKEEARLGKWCCHQKAARKNGKLTSERIKDLEAIPRWFWETDLDEKWQETFELVKIFVEKYKNFPLYSSKNKKEKRLGIWCNTQKQSRKNGNLTSERIKDLESIPGWFWEIDLDEKWQENIESVKTFVEKNEKFPSKESKDKEEKRLGRWCSTQKYTKKGQGRCKITPERIKALESIPNWKWSKK